MPASATVYAPIPLFPQSEHLAPFAGGAVIEARAAEMRAVIAWPDLEIVLTRMPDAEMGRHLVGLQGLVRGKGGGEALATRVLATLSVYGFVVTPGFDAGGRAMRLIRGVTAATDGLCMLADGRLCDGDERALLGGSAPALATPPAGRVAARALVLVALAMRGLLDDDAGKPDAPRAEELRASLVRWADRHAAVRGELEAAERQLLTTPIGGAPRQPIVNAVWGAEGAQVLLHALGARELPAHDFSEHPYRIARSLGVLADAPPEVARAPRLLPEDEIARLQRRLLAVHWRAVEQRVRPGPVDFASLARKEFLRGVDLAGIPLAEGDLAVKGAPIHRASQGDVAFVGSIALERHRAANWLIGVHGTYSRVATPT